MPPGVDEAYAAAANTYFRTELAIEFPERYQLESDVKYDFALPDGSNVTQTYFNVAKYVSNAMNLNPGMRLFMAAGYYDLWAPFAGAERTATHNGFPRDRITIKRYNSGHRVYMQADGSRQLNADLRAFVTARN